MMKPMKVLVSDTSILIDLERGTLLTCFLLPFQFVVPDLLYERELKNHGGDLLRLGLLIEELDQRYRREQPLLSLPDRLSPLRQGTPGPCSQAVMVRCAG